MSLLLLSLVESVLLHSKLRCSNGTLYTLLHVPLVHYYSGNNGTYIMY